MDKLKNIILLIVKRTLNLKKALFFNNRMYFVFFLSCICLFFPISLTYQSIKNIKNSLKVNVKRNTPPLIALMDENIPISFKVKKTQSLLLGASLQKRKPRIFSKNSLISSKRTLHIKKPLLISSGIIKTKSIKTKPFKSRSLEAAPLKILRLKGITLSRAGLLPYREEQINRTIISQTQTLEKDVDESVRLATFTPITNQPSGFEKRWFAYMQDVEKEKNKASNVIPSLNKRILAEKNFSGFDKSINPSQKPSVEYVDMISASNISVDSVDRDGARDFMPEQKWVGNVWVGLPGQKPSPKPNPLIISYNTRDNSERESSNFDNKNIIPSEKHPIEYVDMISASSMSSVDSTDKNLQGKLENLSLLRVLGDITLFDGLGLLEGDNLNVAYVDSCSFIHEADVDLQNGRFSIDIEDPSYGFLRAQLRDKDGLLRGTTRISLRQFFRDKLLEDSNFAFRDTLEIDLQIAPFNPSSAVQVFNIGNDRKPLKETLIEIEDIGRTVRSGNQGLFSIPEMLIGSSFIAKIHADNLFGALFLSTNDMTQNWEIPDNTLITALQRHVPNLDLDLGVIWGRVLKDGTPVEGVSLELAERQSRLYYLTEDHRFITGDTTTSTGYFVYVDVPPGIQLLKGHSESFSIPPRVLWTDRGYISSVKLEETLKKEAEGCIFDSETGDLLSARVNHLGSETGEMESGHLNLSFFNGVDPLYFEVRPNDRGYHPMILTSHRKEDAIAFPVPSRAWSNQLAAKYKITQHPGLSMIIGHISHSSFRVYKENASDHTEIVYFNRETSSQEPLPYLERGGFVLFNVDPGLQSVILEPLHAEQKVAIKTVIADSDFVSVFSHDF